MIWISRLRLLLAVLLVLTIAAGLTIVFNQRQRESASVSAAISQPGYDVAAVVPGVMVEVEVALGDEVEEGQVLATMSSVELQQDAVNGLGASSNSAMDVDPETGTVVYRATAAGRVTELSVTEGTFLSSGTAFASIVQSTPRSVEAEFQLTPRDYGRLEPGAEAEILLPDNRTITGTVESASVVTENGQALTRVIISSSELGDEELGLIATDGAPVAVTVHLEDSGILAGPTDALRDLLRTIGLR